ncbi:hypothetical protein JCM1841_004997 [Sporobolomyces salmonicolor]
MARLLDNLAIAVVAALMWLLYKRCFQAAPKKDKVSASGDKESDQTGPYRFPPFESLPNYDLKHLEATKPLPYRPFRWGPTYPQHMAIRNITEPETWLQLDNAYSSILKVRTERTLDLSLQSTATQPTFHAHALEALCEIASFLSTRFPQLFRVARATYDPRHPATHGDSIVGPEGGAVVAVDNLVTGERFDFAEIEATEGPEWNPMRVAGLLLQDDLAVMVEDEQGHYRLRAGSICTAGFWRLQDKVGLTLDDIHFKGSVPNYAEKYQKSMNRFFSNLREDKLVERNNYFFQVDDGLSWSTQTNGTEKIFDQYNKCAQLGTFEKTDGAVKPTRATQ